MVTAADLIALMVHTVPASNHHKEFWCDDVTGVFWGALGEILTDPNAQPVAVISESLDNLKSLVGDHTKTCGGC